MCSGNRVHHKGKVMLHNLAEKIKHYWAATAAIVAMFGLMASGVKYYAHAETVRLINVEMVKPLEKLNKRADTLDQKLYGLQRDVDKQNEKLNGVKDQLNIIIELMKKDQKK